MNDRSSQVWVGLGYRSSYLLLRRVEHLVSTTAEHYVALDLEMGDITIFIANFIEDDTGWRRYS